MEVPTDWKPGERQACPRCGERVVLEAVAPETKGRRSLDLDFDF
jgi:hypothetical protein